MKSYSQEVPFARHVHQRAASERRALARLPKHRQHAFVNPFQIADLLIFDRHSLCRVLTNEHGPWPPERLAWGMHGAPHQLVQRLLACLSSAERPLFLRGLATPITSVVIEQAQHILLDQCFWELTYWQTPELYDELTGGEHLHPGIFEQLEPWLQGKSVLDIGAGSGRASFAALQHGARCVYAVEPSPGLRRLLCQKLTHAPDRPALVVEAGDFAHVPLPQQSIDLALSCSAFTAYPQQGGERGLAELRRVTRPGGRIVVIWPRLQDRAWLSQHGFHYVALPHEPDMAISFGSWQSAWRCMRRFYGENQEALRYLLYAHEPRVPFRVLGMNAPCDYCWLEVT